MSSKEKQKARVTSSDKLKQGYMDALLTGSNDLASVYAFCKSLKLKESTFYKSFNSFEALEDSIWRDWLQETLEVIKTDPNYLEYSVREKLLSFYFTWFEILLANRSFVSLSLQNFQSPENIIKHNSLKSLKATFVEYSNDLIMEGGESGEIPTRQNLLNKSYPNGLWLQFLFLLNFWKNDQSNDFANTDAAIEKSVNLSMDLIGHGPVDAIVDFAKFMFQQAR